MPLPTEKPSTADTIAGTRLCVRRNTSAGPSCENVADTTAETRMHCAEILGQSLITRDFERKDTELRTRAAALNGHTVLGIRITEPTG